MIIHGLLIGAGQQSVANAQVLHASVHATYTHDEARFAYRHGVASAARFDLHADKGVRVRRHLVHVHR
jgi:hypothetical protein